MLATPLWLRGLAGMLRMAALRGGLARGSLFRKGTTYSFGGIGRVTWHFEDQASISSTAYSVNRESPASLATTCGVMLLQQPMLPVLLLMVLMVLLTMMLA